jgi:hypothetical protein
LGGAGLLGLVFSQAAQAQVKLEYKFPEGKKVTYKTTSKTHQILTLMGMEIATDSEQTVVTSQAVGKRREDSTLPIEVKVESLRAELSLPGGLNVTYDTSDPNAKIENAQLAFLADVFKMASESRYTVILDAQNKVKAIEGAEKLLEKAEKLDPMARDLVRGELKPEKLKSQFEQGLRDLPDVLARTGEPWERDEVVHAGGGQTITFHKKYEYAGTEKKGDQALDKITSKAIEVKLEQDAEGQTPLKITKSDLKVESSEGTVLFDREAGRAVDSRGKTRIKGSVTFTAAGQEIPGELDLTMESHTELQPPAK